MTKKLCIYHANCTDGFGAAWVVWRKFPDTEFFPADYGKPAPDCTGREVIMVDFSYPLAEMQIIAEQCLNLVMLDHHKTAAENLGEWAKFMNGTQKLRIEIDMTRSGALMTWDYFFPDDICPPLIRYISDRDLWQFQMDGTKEFHAYLSSIEQDFSVWEMVSRTDVAVIRSQGEAILRKFNKDVAALVKSMQMELAIGGEIVPAANIPFLYASEAGHIMGKGKPYAACFTLRQDGVAFSLRSPEDGADVSAIAKQYGGGGHKHAAGFQVDYATFQSFTNPQPRSA